MTSIAQQVRDEINDDLYLKEALARDIANQSKLARWLKEARGIDEKISSIKSGIRSYVKGLEDERVRALGSLPKVEASVNLREDVAVIVLPRTRRARQRVSDLFDEVDVSRGERLALVPGQDNMVLLLGSKSIGTAKTILGPKLADEVIDDLVEFSFIPSGDHEPEGGLLWMLISTLHARGIEPRFAFSSHPEHYVLVPFSKRIEAHEALDERTLP